MKQNTFSRKDIPVLVSAFGTTESAFSTYEKMDAVFREKMPGLTVYWSYSSRMVKTALKRKKDVNLPDPAELLFDLARQGHQWAVLQSLHVVGGHEFHRLAFEGRRSNLRLSMGLPLLSSPEDYREAARALAPVMPGQGSGCATVLLGHGTDHPVWASYLALETIMRREYGGDHIFTGVVDGYPSMEITVDRVRQSGFSRVVLIPFMLVAGVHFKEDIAGETDSWQAAFEAADIGVSVVQNGIGALDGISSLFARHIEEALDVIPL
ncbi:MAG: sirohydrochlorin cobaltochelatase [Desulfobacteraceae bacterium]